MYPGICWSTVIEGRLRYTELGKSHRARVWELLELQSSSSIPKQNRRVIERVLPVYPELYRPRRRNRKAADGHNVLNSIKLQGPTCTCLLGVNGARKAYTKAYKQ